MSIDVLQVNQNICIDGCVTDKPQKDAMMDVLQMSQHNCVDECIIIKPTQFCSWMCYILTNTAV